jgi:hypothetical protein
LNLTDFGADAMAQFLEPSRMLPAKAEFCECARLMEFLLLDKEKKPLDCSSGLNLKAAAN